MPIACLPSGPLTPRLSENEQLKPSWLLYNQDGHAKLPKSLVTSFGKAGHLLVCLAEKEPVPSLL